MLLYVSIAVCHDYTHNDIYLWLYILPSIYMVPMLIIMFIYAWIINPLKDLKK